MIARGYMGYCGIIGPSYRMINNGDKGEIETILVEGRRFPYKGLRETGGFNLDPVKREGIEGN